MSLLSNFGNNAKVRSQRIDRRNLRNEVSIRSKVTLPILNTSYRIARSTWTILAYPKDWDKVSLVILLLQGTAK